MTTRFEKRAPTSLYVFIVLSTLVVFAADSQTRIGVAIWLFYLVPLGASIFASRPLTPIYVAAATTVLLIVGYLIAPSVVSSNPVAQLNRGFGLIMVWAFAVQTHWIIQSRLVAQKRGWMRAAQTQLAARLMGDQSIESISHNVLDFVATYLDAKVGALYVCEAGDRVVRTAGFALAQSESVRQEFQVGQGLLGQAIASKQATRITDLPAEYLSVTSALGQRTPVSLLICPLTADAEVVGALELGLLHESYASDLELLNLVAESAGVALRTARFRSEREQLLRATQQQAEELQTQQEELRVTNEELESQSKMLRDSQARLEAQQAELEQTNVQLEEYTQVLARQNDELAAARQALLAKTAELERSNQFKSEFLANMSHELRTPLNSSLILAKLLSDNRDGNLTDEQVRFARNIHSAGNDLLELVNDILDLSKIEARKIEVNRDTIDLRRLVEDLLQTFRPMAEQKRVTIRMSVDADAPASIHSDWQRLRQVLKNLLSNALKFTSHGTVSLRAYVPAGEGDSIALAVKDTGIGIAPDQREIIFDPFRQADGTTNRRYGGTGLGLSISRELATLLGGRIELQSTLGEGSTFTLIIPQTLPVQARTESRPSAEPRVPRARPPARPLAFASRQSNAAVAQDTGSVPGFGRLLLIIEDDAAFAGTLCELGRTLHYECIVALTADQGIELALQRQPTAIVLDIRLPDHTGLAVLDRLKHNSATRHIPIQVISGYDYTQAALEMGAASVMRKPVDRDRLVEALARLEHRAKSGEQRAVLIVEDNTLQRDSICELLASENVRTVAVASAAAALEQLRSTTFDCMVLDLALPDASGFELLESMANDHTCSFPPVIVYTGRSLSADEEQQLRRYSKSIIIKGARSPERLLDEVTLFLHQVEAKLPAQQRRMLQQARSRESVFEGRRILLAEDDVRNVFAITRVLEPHGVKVEIARNGKEAVAMLQRDDDFDLVLMDIMMPEMNGIEAMQEIRKRLSSARLPIIALTAKAMPDDRQRCLDAGANDYITKPIDIEKLLSLVRIWMPPRSRVAS